MATPKKTLTAAEKAARDKKREQDFIRVVNPRVSKVLASTAILRKMANARTYKFNSEQVDRIEVALEASKIATVKAFRDALKGVTATTEAAGFDVTK